MNDNDGVEHFEHRHILTFVEARRKGTKLTITWACPCGYAERAYLDDKTFGPTPTTAS